jgi:hypothetical protein
MAELAPLRCKAFVPLLIFYELQYTIQIITGVIHANAKQRVCASLLSMPDR